MHCTLQRGHFEQKLHSIVNIFLSFFFVFLLIWMKVFQFFSVFFGFFVFKKNSLLFLCIYKIESQVCIQIFFLYSFSFQIKDFFVSLDFFFLTKKCFLFFAFWHIIIYFMLSVVLKFALFQQYTIFEQHECAKKYSALQNRVKTLNKTKIWWLFERGIIPFE